tara:strand:+ start:1028 stop:1369 length:342 start_codon:yes stop_codon:yes gene_type:complete
VSLDREPQLIVRPLFELLLHPEVCQWIAALCPELVANIIVTCPEDADTFYFHLQPLTNNAYVLRRGGHSLCKVPIICRYAGLNETEQPAFYVVVTEGDYQIVEVVVQVDIGQL